MRRCSWVNLDNPLYVIYHDEEWGRPQHDDRRLYEMVVLECFQAGLSWECILNKRESFREAFAQFDADKVAAFVEADVDRLMADARIVRNRLKILAAINNSKVFKHIQEEWGSFDHYIWHFTDGQTIDEAYTERTTSPLSDEVSKDMRKRGMKFVGSTTVYSLLQSIGIINAHGPECDLHHRA